MRGAAVLLGLVAAATSAEAQEPAWATSRTPRGVSAELALSGDARLKAQCDAGTIYLLLYGPGVAGLPDEVTAQARPGDAPEVTGSWLRWDEGGPLLSRTPARNIRAVLRMDHLVLPLGPWRGDPAATFGADLPADDGPLRAVLEDCGEPAASERDRPPEEVVAAAREAELTPIWSRAPAPRFPETARRAGQTRGEVWINCRIGSGGVLTDCRAESAFPAGYGFAEAALAAASTSRLHGGVEGGHVAFRVAFRMAG